MLIYGKFWWFLILAIYCEISEYYQMGDTLGTGIVFIFK